MTFAQRRATVADPDPRYDDITMPAEYRESLVDEIAELADNFASKRPLRMTVAERAEFTSSLRQFGNLCYALCVARGDADAPCSEPTFEDIKKHAGRLFIRAFAWIAEAKSLVAFGQRARVMIYVLQPALIGAATLETLGAEMGVTRQAVHKLKRELEDTFRDCFPTRSDKSDEARDKCKTTPHLRDY